MSNKTEIASLKLAYCEKSKTLVIHLDELRNFFFAITETLGGQKMPEGMKAEAIEAFEKIPVQKHAEGISRALADWFINEMMNGAEESSPELNQ